MLCPCHSNKMFKDCCQPFINGTKKVTTAEQLMRSRFSAYAIKAINYIVKTYAISQQHDRLESEVSEWANDTKWVNLEILNADESNNSQRFVEFKASYINNNSLSLMHERSRFILENDQWRYIDGDIILHALQKKLTRNTDCPCQSDKKYKRCCMI